MKNDIWYEAQVIHGGKTGRKIGYPTINLSFDPSFQINPGVYASLIKYQDKIYQGLLYFGPRLVKQETHNVLEIHILDFNKEIYGEIIEYKILDFIRGVKKFKSEEELRRQIEEDEKAARNLFYR